MKRRASVEDVLAAFASDAPATVASGERLPGSSAVLVAVYRAADGAPMLLYTRRASTMRRHAGELSFPGGRIDPSDAHPLAAALREAEEEVGLSPRDVRVLGHLTDMTTHYGVLVSAYVGLVEGAPPEEPRSKDEVEEVLPVPVEWLLDDWRYEARAHVEMPDRAVHYWRLPGATMWGITGELTARFLRRAWGWEPPSRPRLIDDISEFRPAPG
jgi:8-oxo-dGTP pyrophosphatase MutT (NUDIX family)